MISDEHLLAEWQRDRGEGGKHAPVPAEDLPVLLRNLRARYERLKNPPELKYCDVCGVKARGPHLRSTL